MGLDLRQTDFLRYYLDPKSETYSNALQSALKAGYNQEYAENITHLMPDWLSEAIGRRKRMLIKAENRLEQLIESKDERVAADVGKFIAKTIGKEEGYSERTEHTGANGKDLPTPIIQLNNALLKDNCISEDREPDQED